MVKRERERERERPGPSRTKDQGPRTRDLLKAISRGEFATAGFRNRDLRLLTEPTSRDASPEVQRRLAAKISRRLRLLRAHGLIRKVPKTHRYFLTVRGQLLTAALFAIRDANVKQLIAAAAGASTAAAA